MINTGDYLQRITSDRLRSTSHRVARPRDEAQHDVARVSDPDGGLRLGDTRSTSKFYGDGYAVD